MIRRRILAAIALTVFAVGSSLFWNGWEIEWISLGFNLAAALIGFVILHFRWRRQEARALTPNKAKDIFS